MIDISVLREAFLNAKTLKRIAEKHRFTDLCGGIVDISNYTMVTSSISMLKHKPKQKMYSYLSIFNNTMQAIARNFGAEDVINTFGDKVEFFFPKTHFKDVLKCGLAMQAAHDDMNQKYYEEGLPPINYRIGADCGKHQLAISGICLNIYGIAPNRMVIGENLHDMLSNSFEDDYHFTKIHEYHHDKNAENPYWLTLAKVNKNPYSVYLISVKTGVNVAVPAIVMPPELEIKDREAPGWGLEEGAQKFNIMLIDDEPDMIITYKSFLHPEGYKVDAFSNSQEALRHFVQVSPSYYDLVIMDIRMSNLNGLQLYNRMKAINSSVKVLFVSALDAVEELISILPDIKRNSIIRKPVEKDHLIRTV